MVLNKKQIKEGKKIWKGVSSVKLKKSRKWHTPLGKKMIDAVIRSRKKKK